MAIDWSSARLAQEENLDLAQPTKVRPGSADKVELMRLRWEAGVPLNVAGDSDHSSELTAEPDLKEEGKADEPSFQKIRRTSATHRRRRG